MRPRVLVSTVTVSAVAFAATALIALGSRDPNPAEAAARGPKTAAEQLEAQVTRLVQQGADETDVRTLVREARRSGRR